MGIIRIPIGKVKNSMVAGADILSCGKVLVRRNDRLTKSIINALKYNGFTSVPVLVKELNRDYNLEDYYGALDEKCSAREIKRLNKDFKQQVNNLKSQLNSLLKGNEKTIIEDLLNNIKTITNKADSPYKLFEVMRSMKDYDDSTYVHSLNVALVGMVLADWVNIPAEEVYNVALAGMLHDIGKTLIPKEILNKPGRLTKEEFEVIKKHPLLGYNLIKDLDINEGVKLAVLQHHEKCDGSGYPYGLKSKEINDVSKIITIADIYDAMTSARCYRETICPFEVLQNFEEDGVKKYEARFLFPFFKGIVQTYLNRYVKLSDGEIGEVVMIHNHDITRPLVRTQNRFIDLSIDRNIKIKDII